MPHLKRILDHRSRSPKEGLDLHSSPHHLFFRSVAGAAALCYTTTFRRSPTMTEPIQRYTLELDAHSIDDEFEQTILREYDVKITDRSGEPWSVIFEGTREQLRAMIKNNWGDRMEVSDEEFAPVVAA